MHQHYDVIIVGAGLAGLTVALNLPSQLKIALLYQDDLNNSSSSLAQGGMAAVLDSQDSFAQHIQDTMIASANLADPQMVEYIVSQAPQALQWLQQLDVPFTCNEQGELHLHQEGGHSCRRIAHAKDGTGWAISQQLQYHLSHKENITCFGHLIASALIQDNNTCIGLQVFNPLSQKTEEMFAHRVVLATGGVGQVFARTTNPSASCGDGLAIAWQVGCRVANCEFMQFHPTSLVRKDGGTFLISEALRGEGALLCRADGTRFMPEYDPRHELAPRDIVARAIAEEEAQSPTGHIYLDISHRPKAFLIEHFPDIYRHCLNYGFDISLSAIPVAPAAHYFCGGIVTDRWGHTDVTNLYAVGEVAYTGLHGANRLASNSLLECVVIGKNIAQDIQQKNRWVTAAINAAVEHIEQPKLSRLPVAELQTLMSKQVGIVRDNAGLSAAVSQLEQAINGLEYSGVDIKQQHLHICAWLIARSAKKRRGSLGLHYNKNCPSNVSEATPTVLQLKKK